MISLRIDFWYFTDYIFKHYGGVKVLTLVLLIIFSASYTTNPHRGHPCPSAAFAPEFGLASELEKKQNSFNFIILMIVTKE